MRRLLLLLPSLALAALPFACSSTEEGTSEADASSQPDGTIPTADGNADAPSFEDVSVDADAGADAEVVVIDLVDGGPEGCKATCAVVPKTTPVCGPIDPSTCTLACTAGTNCAWSCPVPSTCKLTDPPAPHPECTLACDATRYACTFDKPECEIKCSDELCTTKPPEYGCVTRCKEPRSACTRIGADAGPTLSCHGGPLCSTGCSTAKCGCKSDFSDGGTCERYPTDGAPPVDCGDAAVIPQQPVCEPPACGLVNCNDGPVGCDIICNEVCTPFSNCTTVCDKPTCTATADGGVDCSAPSCKVTCATGGDCSIRRCDVPL